MRDDRIDIRRYPELQLLCWNHAGHFIEREDAFALYEREWRLIDADGMISRERELLRSLADEFGQGLVNA
ncbi:MAG: hypothetical protein CSB44_11735 [Gammaproteobacteria bacterium]|nr:MAG: hypothetical protein CSB44_11735 [Gammaproteobacteria bacterium]PIE37688.1 MAG: hypothetical protein CSA54_00915 [Gammaproteobacteria bacterium]